MQEVPVVSIVDDDESVRIGMSNLIRSMGWYTHVFASAQAFLDSGLAATVRCLISDLQMPGMTGLELQQRLIADGHNLPIIFITGFGSDAARKQAIDNGAVGFLDKPVDVAAIQQYLNGLCDEGNQTSL